MLFAYSLWYLSVIRKLLDLPLGRRSFVAVGLTLVRPWLARGMKAVESSAYTYTQELPAV
jgi:hypothetical protein